MKLGILSHLHFPIAEPFAGGLEAHTAATARAMAARGHDVVVAAKAGSRIEAPSTRGPAARGAASGRCGRVELVKVLGAEFAWRKLDDGHASDAQEQAIAGATLRGIEALQAAGCDAILNNSLSPVPYLALDRAAMLTLLHTPPTLARVNEVLARPGWRPGPRHAWASVSAVTAEGWRGLVPGIEVISNGLDLSAWPARLGTRPEGAPPRAVWTGRLTPEKDPRIAIEAALLAGWRLDLAGPRYDERYVDREIAPLLGGPIRYLGHLDRPRLSTLVRAADVQLVTPRWPEPFGLVALEAMASGTPVAALGEGALPELLGACGGAIAEEATPASLAEAMRRAAAMPRALVRRRAERFDEGRAVDRYLEILAELAARPTPRAMPEAAADGAGGEAGDEVRRAAAA